MITDMLSSVFFFLLETVISQYNSTWTQMILNIDEWPLVSMHTQSSLFILLLLLTETTDANNGDYNSFYNIIPSICYNISNPMTI